MKHFLQFVQYSPYDPNQEPRQKLWFFSNLYEIEADSLKDAMDWACTWYSGGPVYRNLDPDVNAPEDCVGTMQIAHIEEPEEFLDKYKHMKVIRRGDSAWPF